MSCQKELPACEFSCKETFAMIPYHQVHMGTRKHIAASHWWSGSSQTCSDWSNPEQWPAERLNTDQCERSSELPYLGLPRHHGAAGGGGEGGGRGLGHPQQVQCRPLSSELSEGKNANDWGKTTKNYFIYFRQRDLMWVQFRGKTSGQASTPLWLSHLHSRYVELFEAKKRRNQSCLYRNADGKLLSFAIQGEERCLRLLQAAVTREERLERSGYSGGDFESYFHFYACLNIIHTSMS